MEELTHLILNYDLNELPTYRMDNLEYGYDKYDEITLKKIIHLEIFGIR